jgi:hypothetical protein
MKPRNPAQWRISAGFREITTAHGGKGCARLRTAENGGFLRKCAVARLRNPCEGEGWCSCGSLSRSPRRRPVPRDTRDTLAPRRCKPLVAC